MPNRLSSDSSLFTRSPQQECTGNLIHIERSTKIYLSLRNFMKLLTGWDVVFIYTENVHVVLKTSTMQPYSIAYCE